MIAGAHAFRSEAGFSLIELLASISVLGVLTLTAAPSFIGFMPEYRSRAAALMVAGELNQARLSAMRENRRYRFSPLGVSAFRIDRLDAAGNPTLVRQADVSTEFPGVVFAATDIPSDPYGNADPPGTPNQPIIFHSDGTVQNPSGIFVEPALHPAQAQHGVMVTGAGRVRVWRWVAGVWS